MAKGRLRQSSALQRPTLHDLMDVVTGEDGAIVPMADGSLQVGGAVLTPTGLQLPDDFGVEAWEYLGAILFRLEGSINWLIGDWLNYGENHKYGEMEAIAEKLGRKASSLYDVKYVCSNIEFSARAENLSFRHHKLVAKMGRDEQRYWLRRAEENGWSIAQMRAEITKDTNPPTPPEYRVADPETMKTIKRLLSLDRRLFQNASREMKIEIRAEIAEIRRWLDEVEGELG